jgi:hypothetical protein
MTPALLPGLTSGPLDNLSCASSSFCMAEGSLTGTDAFWVFSGGKWSESTLLGTASNSNGIQPVSCASSSFCVMVDGSGNAYIYSNGTWSAPDPIDPGNEMEGVSCPTSSFCEAIDDTNSSFTYSGGS